MWTDGNLGRLLGEDLTAPPHHEEHDKDRDRSYGLKDALLESLQTRVAQMNGPLDDTNPNVAAAAQPGLQRDTLESERRLSANDLGFDYWSRETEHADWLT